MNRGVIVLAAGVMAGCVLTGFCADAAAPKCPLPGAWRLDPTTSDEFDGDKLDKVKWWDYLPNFPGRQTYFNHGRNVKVKDGCLELWTVRETDPEKMPYGWLEEGREPYSTCAIKSRVKVYGGYFECRLKMNTAPVRSAFWLYDPLSDQLDKKWAPGEFSEEIDICEVEGKHQAGDAGKPYLLNNATHHYVTPYYEGVCNHVNVPYGRKIFIREDISDDFHTYGFYWGKTDLVWYMDGKETYRIKHSNNSYGGYYRPLHVVLDSEIVEWWLSRCRNPPIDPKLLPSVAKVDWVRHWVEVEPASTNDEVSVMSTLDGSLQPARFFVPESAKGRKAPLLVALHTWSYDHRGEWPWSWAKPECEKRGWVLVAPSFRGPNWTPAACGSDLAVRDIFDAVNYAKRHADIDEDRVYLAGGSGGGHMSLLMAGRHPEVWAGVYAACPITDIARWHAESVQRKRNYANHIVQACGGTPSEKPEECRHRSPLTFLAAARKAGTHIQIATGIHDGHDGNSVPVGHAIRGYNALADAKDAISEADIAFMEEKEKVPEALRFAGSDPFFNAANRIHLRRTSANVRFTLFEGGHEGNFDAGIDWLARQRRGRPVDWTLPATATGRSSAVSK